MVIAELSNARKATKLKMGKKRSLYYVWKRAYGLDFGSVSVSMDIKVSFKHNLVTA